MARWHFVAVRFLMLAGLVASLPAAASAQYTSTTFFVGAHQDDWQLFMQPNAFHDAQNPNVKVVFIYTTAGEAGCATGCVQNDGRTPYFLARENGAKRAARFVGTRPGAAGGPGAENLVKINGHRVGRYVYNNTVSYFLRLPDGNINGLGFAGTGFNTLEKLHSGAIATISDVIAQTQYLGWSDLVATLEAILVTEAAGSSNVWVNVQDPNTAVNTNDHSDHTFTGRAMLDAVASHPCVNQAKFLDYVTGGMPMNLSATDLTHDAAVWGATVSGLIDSGASNSYEPGHNSWLGRNYFSVVAGTGACTF